MRLCGERLGGIWVQEDSSLETRHSRKHGQRVQTLSWLVAPSRMGCLTPWYPVLLAGARGCRWMESDVHSRPPQALLSTEAPESKRSPGHFWGASGEGRREVPGRGAETPATLARPALGRVSRTRPDPCHSGGLVKGPGGLREAPLAGRSRLRLIISPKPPPHCRLLNVRPSGRKCWHFSWCVPLSPCSPMSS